MKQLPLLLLGLLALAPLHAQGPAGAVKPEELFALDNLQAWCVVPFDAKKRGPVERAEMLHRLGFKRFVYDWRAKDIPAFDAEFEAMKKHGIEITAWWSPTDPRDPVLLKTLEVFQRQKVHPQLWVMGRGAPANTPEEQQQRVEQEAGRIREIAEVARPYGCKVGLYNHGGWFGQTDNQVAVIERLAQLGVTDVGIVYNFSHGHGDIADFAPIWKRMQPYVVAVNVTGMVEDGESKIMPPSQGEFELAMLRVILDSGWRGPIGLIEEQGGDAEVTLGNYLRGLEWCKKELAQPGSGGPRPDFSARPKNGAAKLPEREPLDPVAHPFSTHPVNRDRIYDFYAKQARDYAASAEKPALLRASPSAAYGSEEYSVRSPDQRGHDVLAISSAHMLENGRALFLEIPQLQPANVLHLHCDLPGIVARDFYLTLHRLGPAFTQFPGYRAIAKTDPHIGHHMPATASDIAPKPVKWEQGPPGRALRIQTSGGLQFAQKELRAKAGERLSLSFENPDAMPHNWVLVKLGAIERVGDLATKLITAPDAVARHYVPDSPDVLAHTRILDPQKTTTIHFTAPAQPGRYPYVCTFPGHWMLMRGELVVE